MVSATVGRKIFRQFSDRIINRIQIVFRRSFLRHKIKGNGIFVALMVDYDGKVGVTF